MIFDIAIEHFWLCVIFLCLGYLLCYALNFINWGCKYE